MLKIALSWWENADQLVNEIFLKYPNMANEDLLIRTQAATEMFTDWTWGSAAAYEAGAHAR